MKKKFLFAACLIVLLLSSCAHKEVQESTETHRDPVDINKSIQDSDVEKTSNSDITLFSGYSDFTDVYVGDYYNNTGALDAITISLPSDWMMKDGIVSHAGPDGGKITEEVSGKISELVEKHRINEDDLKLSGFYVGTGDFNQVEPAANDAVLHVKVYPNYNENFDQADYTMTKDGLTFYGFQGKERDLYKAYVRIPVSDILYVCIDCIHMPGDENVSVESFTQAVTGIVAPAPQPTDSKDETSTEDMEITNGASTEDMEITNGTSTEEKETGKDGFGIPLLYNQEDISEDLIQYLKEDGWYVYQVIAHTVSFVNEKYPSASFEIRFSDLIDVSIFDKKIDNLEGIDTSEVDWVTYWPGKQEENHPSFECMGINSSMACKEALNIIQSLELENPDSIFNWDDIDSDGSGKSQRWDINTGNGSYDLQVEYKHGRVTSIAVLKS